MDIRPQDLPEIRAEIRQQVAHPGLIQPLLDALEIRPGGDSEDFVEALQGAVDAVTLFHVSGPMTDLVCAASDALDVFTPDRTDMPSQGGLVVFDGHIPKKMHFDDGCTTSLRGILWFAHADRPELTVIPIAEPHGGIPVAGRLIAYPFFCFVAPLDEAVYASSDTALWNVDLVSLLLTTWLLMKQPLAELSETSVDRAARKRLRRVGQEPKPVRVVELRRPQTSSDHGDGDREYHHQWIVRGHWRQQWHPKRQVHRPVWIAPHIKGPEGAPLIGGEKVYAWKR